MQIDNNSQYALLWQMPSRVEDCSASNEEPQSLKQNRVAHSSDNSYTSLARARWSGLVQYASTAQSRLRMLCLRPKAGIDKEQMDDFFRRNACVNWSEACLELIKENTSVANTMLSELFASPWTNMSMFDVFDAMIEHGRPDVLTMLMSGQPGRFDPKWAVEKLEHSRNPALADVCRPLLPDREKNKESFAKVEYDRVQLIRQNILEASAPYRDAVQGERKLRAQQNSLFSNRAKEVFAERCLRCGLDPAHPERSLDSCLWQAPFSQSLQVYCMNNEISALVWKQGPHAGKIFQLFDTSTEMSGKAVPDCGSFKQAVETLLYSLESRLWTLREEYVAQAKVDLHTSVVRMYYEGTPDTVPLSVARMRDEELNALCQKVHENGVIQWLDSLAFSNAMSHLQVSAAPTSADWRYFYPKVSSDSQQRHGDYSHGTTSAILPGLLSTGALLSSDQLTAAGLHKLSGEFERSTTSINSDVISFWDHKAGRALHAPYGEIAGFDFPMALTVAKKTMAGCIVQAGVLPDEVTVPDRFHLEDIESILVPPFAQQYVRELLALHGYGSVGVLPLTARADN